MDTQTEAAGSTAAELLATASVSSLATILRANSDFAKDDARALAAAVLAEPYADPYVPGPP